MATCNQCKCFFVSEEDAKKGDCVQRVVDPRQAYYKAKPVEADKDASKCPSFQKR
ncbi:MAG: benzylsuccinate synthase gamma subunit family protein [bacterium]